MSATTRIFLNCRTTSERASREAQLYFPGVVHFTIKASGTVRYSLAVRRRLELPYVIRIVNVFPSTIFSHEPTFILI